MQGGGLSTTAEDTCLLNNPVRVKETHQQGKLVRARADPSGGVPMAEHPKKRRVDLDHGINPADGGGFRAGGGHQIPG